MAAPAVSRATRAWLAHAMATSALLAGIFYAYLGQPHLYLALIVEDGFGEYLTAALYAAAAILLGLYTFNRSGRRWGYLLLLACFVFMAGEEISWGQRIFNIATPEYFVAKNYQGELSIHNLVRINRYLNLLGAAVLLWAAITPWWTRFTVGRWLDNQIGVPAAKGYQFPLFFLAVLILIGRPFYQGAELGELLLAIAFFVFAASYWTRLRHHPRILVASFLAGALATAFALAAAYPGNGLFRTHRLAANYAHHRLCWQAADLYDDLRHGERYANPGSMLFSPHHATIEYGKMLRYAGDQGGAEDVLRLRLSELMSATDGRFEAIRLEQLGDLHLHLREPEKASAHYRRALAVQNDRVEAPDAAVTTKYVAYIRAINIHAKLDDLPAADAARAELLALDLNVAQAKRVKHLLRDYRKAKNGSLLVLTPTESRTWGKLGGKPTGDCSL